MSRIWRLRAARMVWTFTAQFYKTLTRRFSPGGTICFEFGFGQETALTELLQAAGYEDVTLRKDLRGVVRAVSAKKPEA